MTLTAVLVSDDSVELLTDSLSYKRNLGGFAYKTKTLLLHHLPAAVLNRGDGLFGDLVHSTLSAMCGQPECQDLDALVADCPKWLRDAWFDASEASRGDHYMYPSTVYIAGWSPAGGKFVAFLLSSLHDFEPQPIEGLHVYPMIGAYRPSALEMESFVAENHAAPGLAKFIDAWGAQPMHPPPVDLEDWLKVGLLARTRGFTDWGKILVGGSLFHTRLTQDVATTIRLHQFDDTGDELLEMVGYSQHPVAQERLCWCDSGKRHVDCHLAPQLDKPCGCGAARTFRDCCMVIDDRDTGRLPSAGRSDCQSSGQQLKIQPDSEPSEPESGGS